MVAVLILSIAVVAYPVLALWKFLILPTRGSRRMLMSSATVKAGTAGCVMV